MKERLITNINRYRYLGMIYQYNYNKYPLFKDSLGQYYLEDGLDDWPGGGVAPGHDGGAVAGPLLPPRHTRPNKQDTSSHQLLGATTTTKTNYNTR